MLEEWIQKGEIDKLVCFTCREKITDQFAIDILEQNHRKQLVEKFKKFKEDKEFEADPLGCYCPKAGCSAKIRAANDKVSKLECPSCKTQFCFQCREEWHGNEIKCNQAINKDLQEWVNLNKDKVSRCPKCKALIEKNHGCNHMTCVLCKYEFCWACGGSAYYYDNHFTRPNGCGVLMFQENVRPGDGQRQNQNVRRRGGQHQHQNVRLGEDQRQHYCVLILKYIGAYILQILAYPFFVVLYGYVYFSRVPWTDSETGQSH